MAARTRKGGACFMASAFDVDSLARIAPLCDAIKLASGDLTFDPLLARAATLDQPMVLSTGMAKMAEIAHAVSVIEGHLPAGDRLPERLALLHCVSLYPTAIEQANLSAMSALRNRFALTTGYSDHTLGIEAALVALGMGARIIEKHFTLDKATSAFRDHALSADPAEMTRLATIVRNFGALQGDGEKGDAIADAAMAQAVRRSAVLARDMPAGAMLAAADLDFVRPGGGITPTDAPPFVGRKLACALARHTVLTPAHFE
jgi:N-acetylneuraminate synthase/N,N'-diacetyllegionaminate synthase